MEIFFTKIYKRFFSVILILLQIFVRKFTFFHLSKKKLNRINFFLLKQFICLKIFIKKENQTKKKFNLITIKIQLTKIIKKFLYTNRHYTA